MLYHLQKLRVGGDLPADAFAGSCFGLDRGSNWRRHLVVLGLFAAMVLVGFIDTLLLELFLLSPSDMVFV